MTRRRWIADEVSGNQAFLTGEHARHLAQVLRARVGQEFDISTGGEVRRGTIVRVGSERVEFELGEAVTEAFSAKVTVAISIFKFDRINKYALPSEQRQESTENKYETVEEAICRHCPFQRKLRPMTFGNLKFVRGVMSMDKCAQ